jgi:hypothetical protein
MLFNIEGEYIYRSEIYFIRMKLLWQKRYKLREAKENKDVDKLL